MTKLLLPLVLAGLLTPAFSAVAADAPIPRVLVLVTSADMLSDDHPTGLWLEEFAVPYLALRKAGLPVTVVSPRGGAVPIDPRSEVSPQQRTAWLPALAALARTEPLTPDILAADYAALFVPGGHGAMVDLATDPAVAALVSDFARTDKVIAAFCHGPAALVGATLADGSPLTAGRRVTAFTDEEEVKAGLDQVIPFSLQERLTSLGAEFAAAETFTSHVVVDGKLVTGQNPASSEAIGEALVKLVGTRK